MFFSDYSTQASKVDLATAVDVGRIMSGLAIIFVVLGFIMFTVAILGCCGACCNVKCMLIGVSYNVTSTLFETFILNVILLYIAHYTIRKDFVILQMYWWLFSSIKHCS